MRLLKLYQLAKGFSILFIFAILLTVFHQYTYSNVPLFTQYLMKTLLAQPGVVGETVNEVNLPGFVIRFFENGTDVLNIIIRIALALLILQVFRFSMRFVETWVKGELREKIAFKLRTKLYKHIQDLSYGYHNNADSGDMIQRVTLDVETTTSFLTETNLQIVYLLATIAFGAYQIFLINSAMVLITFTMIPFVGVASIIYFKKIDKIFQETEKAESKMMTVIQENLSGSRVVRAFANEAFEVDKLDKKNQEFTDIQKVANRKIAVYWGIMDFISITQYTVIIGIGVYFVTKNQMDAPSMIAALALIGMLIWPIRGLGRIINDFGKALVASNRLNEILNEPSEYLIDGHLTPNIKGDIEFQNVSFKFDDTEESLLNDVSFKIKKGQTVAFIGRTGSGKTTLVNLLLRMYEFQKGDIKIDGISIKDIQKKHLRNNIGAVLQDPFLYSKTVYENIAIAAKRNISKEDVSEAAKIAALEKDIHTFNQGYETLVGEKGTTLSGGQKQRVAIARVLLNDHPILIFDDALSAVDTKTDLIIREALKKNNKEQTTIIITHRITTAKEAEKIIVIDQGKIEMSGTHNELSKKPGLYKKLWDIQGRLEKEFEEILNRGDENA